MLKIDENNKAPLDDYLYFVEGMADVYDQGVSGVADKINATFFHGGPFAPKSFSEIIAGYPAITPRSHPSYLSAGAVALALPSAPSRENETVSYPAYVDHGFVHFQKHESDCSWLDRSNLEAIPGATLVALIGAIYHLVFMVIRYFALSDQILMFKSEKRPEDPRMINSYAQQADSVCEAAIDYTRHQNLFYGSLVGLIPFAKPVVWLGQWALYNPNSQPIES